MAAFQNIIDLRLAVSDQVGNRAISDVFQRLVEMAEVDFNSRLRTRHQMRDETLFFEGGVSPLPPDFLELISLGIRPLKYRTDGFNITVPGLQGEVPVSYYARLSSLTSSPTACNWLLRQYPNVYLYGVALQAAKHLKDVELAVQMSSLYAEALQLLKIDDERARYASQPIRVKGPTP